MSGVATAIAGSAVLGAGASAYAGKRQGDAIDKASGISAAAAQRARLDNIALYNPALTDYAESINQSIDPLLQGRTNTYQILGQTYSNADTLLQEGADAANRAILGISGPAYGSAGPQINPNQQQYQYQQNPYQQTGQDWNALMQGQSYGGAGGGQQYSPAVMPSQQGAAGEQFAVAGPYAPAMMTAAGSGGAGAQTLGGIETGPAYQGQQTGAGAQNISGLPFTERSMMSDVDRAEAARWFPDLSPQEAELAYNQLTIKNQYMYGPEGAKAGQLPTGKNLEKTQQEAINAARDLPIGEYDMPLTQSIWGEGGIQPTDFGAAPQAPGGFYNTENLTGTGMTGISTARGDIASGLQGALGATNASLGTISAAQNQALGILGFGGGGSGAFSGGGFGGGGGGGFSRGFDALESAEDRALAEIRGGTDQAVGYMDPFRETGQQAYELEAAMSGALGADAQAQAMAQYQESPGQKYLREQQEQALLRNQAAVGGLGGGNVLTALQEQAAGIAAQDQQRYIENLRSLGAAGMSAAGQQGQFAQTGGITGGQTIADLAKAAASLAGTAGSAGAASARTAATLAAQKQMAAAELLMQGAEMQGNVYGSQANLYGQTGTQQANLATQGGNAIANNLYNTAQQRANLQLGFGTTAAGLETGIAEQVSGLYNQAGQGQANLRTGLGGTLGNIAVGQGNQQANYAMASGANNAATITGVGNALTSGLNMGANALGASGNSAAGMPQLNWNPITGGY